MENSVSFGCIQIDLKNMKNYYRIWRIQHLAENVFSAVKL